MVAIVSTEVTRETAEADGRFWAHERHSFDDGGWRAFNYLADANADINAIASSRATRLLTELTRDEISANLHDVVGNGSQATPIFHFSTATQNAAALRANFHYATRLQAIMIGDFLNTLTDPQLMAAFGLTQVEATALRTNKLQPAANIAASIRAATGA